MKSNGFSGMMLSKFCTQNANKFGKLVNLRPNSKKKGSATECSNYSTIALNSRAFKVMLKILKVRLQQYENREVPEAQAVLGNSRGSTDQIANLCSIMEKARQFQKGVYFCFISYVKASDCADHKKL